MDDTPFSVRVTQRVLEKTAICATALSLIRSGDVIFLDSGSTSSILAQMLAQPTGLLNLTVVTNSVDVARCFALRPGELQRGTRVIMLAGDMNYDPMETHGPKTINDIQQYQADIALLSPWSIDASKGAMNLSLAGAETARAMIKNSAKKVILADHSKIGRISRSVFCSLQEIDYLIVD